MQKYGKHRKHLKRYIVFVAYVYNTVYVRVVISQQRDIQRIIRKYIIAGKVVIR